MAANSPGRARIGRAAFVPILVFVLAAIAFASMLIGAYPISALLVARIVAGAAFHPHAAGAPWTAAQQTVVTIVRAPRILLAMLAGAGLGISGAALQGLMRNPLVGPDLVGVSGGAAVGGALAILAQAPSAVVVGSAFAGGTLALAVAYTLGRAARGSGALALVLAGVIVGAFCSALIGVLEYLADPRNQLPGIVYWMLGSFASATWQKVVTLGTVTLLGGTALIGLRWRINVLSLGDDDAAALGVAVGKLRWAIVALVSLLVAAQVSVSGGVGWVGLVIPHLARMLVGPDHRRLLPAAALLGAAFLLVVDDIARSVPGGEIPVGVLTALIGTPVFAAVFWRTQARGWAHG